MQKLLLAISFLMGGSLALSSSKISSKLTPKPHDGTNPLEEAAQDLTAYVLTQAQKVDHAMSEQRSEFGAQIVDAIPRVAFEAVQAGHDSIELEERDRPTRPKQPAPATADDKMWAKVLDRRAAAGIGIHEQPPPEPKIPAEPATNGHDCRGCSPFSAWGLNTFQVDGPAKKDTETETKENTGLEDTAPTDTEVVTPY